MATILTEPLKTAEGYYKRAWRDALKAQHPKWKEPAIKRSLAYLWQSRTQAEQDACEQLRDSQALVLPVVDMSIMPDRTVPKNWKVHQRAFPRLAGARVPPAPIPVEPPAPGPPAATSPPRKRVNTTNFYYWPQTRNMEAPIPPYFEKVGDLLDDELATMQAHGTLIEEVDNQEERWHCVQELGQGAHGRALLWVKTNSENIITDRLAIKDTRKQEIQDWLSPINWRDNLPMEIAIERRLASQQHCNINKFRGYRLNMKERRWRLYHDVCDYKNLGEALQYYGMQRVLLGVPSADYEHIPEAFLWTVFNSLVDALLVLKNGNEHDVEGGKWKEIVHLDLSLSNIFVSLPMKEDGTPNFAAKGEPFKGGPPSTEEDEPVWYRTGREEWPHIFIADFDGSFFDLQDEDDEYQDNPVNYQHKPFPEEEQIEADIPKVDGRYPPEIYRDFIPQLFRERDEPSTRDPTIGDDIKITSAADIWALGQVMWNLVQNFPNGGDFRPCFDGGGFAGRHLVDPDLTMYSRRLLDACMFTGEAPYEISQRYSVELRGLIRDCLEWDPRDRVRIEDLKGRIEGFMKDMPGDGRVDVNLYMGRSLKEFEIGREYLRKKRKRDDGDGDEVEDQEARQ